MEVSKIKISMENILKMYHTKDGILVTLHPSTIVCEKYGKKQKYAMWDSVDECIDSFREYMKQDKVASCFNSLMG